MGGRWINLYRVTDPLGHRVGILEARSIQASYSEPELGEELLTHSDYQYSEGYQGALNALLDGGPGKEDPAGERDRSSPG